MRSEFGKALRVTIWGESHGPAIGGEIQGLPCGIPLAPEALAALMARRQGGDSPLTTPRREEDLPRFISGITNGATDGTPLSFEIPNQNQRPGDYQGLRNTPRPSHADYTAPLRFGQEIDLSGGGHFSGRLTAPLCVLGHFALQWLKARGVTIGSHITKVGAAEDTLFDRVQLSAETLVALTKERIPTLLPGAKVAMEGEILAAAKEGDSVGGVIECAAVGLPGGIGNPLYDGVESRLSATLFGLGGMRGIEFGAGFGAAEMRGSQHNDPFLFDEEGRVVTATNHAGGILGGITTGMPLVFRVCFKPTASIRKEQDTVDLTKMAPCKLQVGGRHDPCILVRAVPCVEAATALVLMDYMLERENTNGAF